MEMLLLVFLTLACIAFFSAGIYGFTGLMLVTATLITAILVIDTSRSTRKSKDEDSQAQIPAKHANPRPL